MSKKERKKFVSEFKEFISRGSIVDMAVGVVVGGAFTTIVNTLVKSVLTPLINFIIYLICGKADGNFTGLDIVLIPATTETVNGETVVVKEVETQIEGGFIKLAKSDVFVKSSCSFSVNIPYNVNDSKLFT